MAQIYTWDRQGFENAYWRYVYRIKGCGAATPRNCRCHDTYCTYSRMFFDNNDMFKERVENIIQKVSLAQGSKILVVGCALGYMMEEFKKVGIVAYGCDNSSYIKAVKNPEKVKFPIPDIDVLDASFKTKIQNSFGLSEFDCVITEDVLPSHDSFTIIFNNCESVLKPGLPKSRIVHIVQTQAVSPFTSKTLQEWTSLNTNHTWLDQNGND